MERVVEALIRAASPGELTAIELYGILRLRAEVFVVEQGCVCADPDGRDLEPATRHLWIEDGGEVVAVLRVLAEPGGGSSIGRVVTSASHRSRGLAATLVRRALEDAPRPVHLNAQSHLVDWYGVFGFVADGAEFIEVGIPHTPMVCS